MRRLPFILGSQRICSFSLGGLCNRIVSIGCVVYLARELNYRPVVFWDRGINKRNMVSFGNLFETAELPFELVEGFEARVTNATIVGRYRKLNLFEKVFLAPFHLAIKVQYGNQYGERIIRAFKGAVRNRSAVSLLPPPRSFGVRSNAFFRDGYDLSWLKPIPQINSQISELKKQFTPNTVGIHIRGGDKRNCGFIPPVEKMITRMHAEVELNPDVKFFVASDGDEATKRILDLFEERVITTANSNPQHTFLDGQKEAVLDLFGLAATSRIIGFKYSSFATTASLLGNKPLIRINESLPRLT